MPGQRRVRQHVNPLGLKYQEPRARPIEPPAHLGPEPPIEVELGCADAKFSFERAAAEPETFVVGLEIRDKVVELNRRKLERSGLKNLAFGYVNLNVDLDRVFPENSVQRFHLLFPDPWFKAKHHKRRVVDEGMCRVIRSQLRAGGEFHVASDIYDIAMEFMGELEHPDMAYLGFRNLAGPWRFWRGNPFEASSRREDTTLRRGQRVWRVRYVLDG